MPCIRFLSLAELIVARLFCATMGNSECIIVTGELCNIYDAMQWNAVLVGAERFSNYAGYGHSFEYAGNHVDQTPL